ncbi:MAG TPA: FKBP-type peptidyl-prolyl cis-trans isomerase [Candidatus Acidoferrales bacterium]|nr:FKBP-type peptidyl-prolyl cis-trans isomerase [Candidatus Acidoferrales bacterium]
MRCLSPRDLAAPAVLALLLGACAYPDPNPDNGPVAGEGVAQVSPSPGGDDFNEGSKLPLVTLPDGLKYADTKAGTGAPAHRGDRVSMHYTGWLTSGKKFDSSRDRGQPFDLTLGNHEVIGGWEEGIPGMKVGGRRRLLIPPSLGYGPQGNPPVIPANATLVFIVELVKLTPAPPSPTPSASPSPS